MNQNGTGQSDKHVEWIDFDAYQPDASGTIAAHTFYDIMRQRRTVRQFSDRPVPKEVIEWVIRSAGTSPSGAHKQPWRFVAISSQEIKRKIRVALEEVEKEFYENRASERWLDDLKPFETSPDKAYLETVPWIVIVMALRTTDEGDQVYYINESVGIATGMLLSAAHHAGLSALTHTPSPMKFLRDVLGRPEHERPYMMIPMGYAADNCVVPALDRKDLEDIAVFVD